MARHGKLTAPRKPARSLGRAWGYDDAFAKIAGRSLGTVLALPALHDFVVIARSDLQHGRSE
jgi:hypothetical protein